VRLFRSGEYTTSEISDLFGVARSTIYRALERDRRRKPPRETAHV
jgi:IS30 family transposase